MAERSNNRTSSVKGQQYDDWVCLMCQNLNYSFRKTCNRCRTQTKHKNDHLMQLYQAAAYLELNSYSEQAYSTGLNPQQQPSAYGQHSFPKCLFIELNGDQQEQTPVMKRQMAQQETPRWLNCLIGE